jgi:hypothetical protein
MWATSVIFMQLPKANNHPLGRELAQSGHPESKTNREAKQTHCGKKFTLQAKNLRIKH